MITEIKQNDRYAQQQSDALLAQEGIRRDRNLDYTCGIFDDSYDLLATGSCFKNTIRCTAVAAGQYIYYFKNRKIKILKNI